jgi:membrane protein implicated in regulation of membrane protease activity
VAYWFRRYIWLLVAREPLFTLGKASLHVFCAHVFFVFAGLALLYGEMVQLHGLTAVALVAVTFIALILVAVNELRKQRRRTLKKNREDGPLSPPLLSPE